MSWSLVSFVNNLLNKLGDLVARTPRRNAKHMVSYLTFQIIAVYVGPLMKIFTLLSN